jgi:hypothetical protein
MELSGAGKLIVNSLNLSGGTINKYLYLNASNDIIFVDIIGYPSAGIALSTGSS